MKKTIQIVLYCFVVFFTVQVAAQEETNPDIEPANEKVPEFPEIGPVEIRGNVATSSFSRSLPELKEALHEMNRMGLKYNQKVRFQPAGDHSKIIASGFYLPTGFPLFDNGLNYTLTRGETGFHKIYFKGKEYLCDPDKKTITAAPGTSSKDIPFEFFIRDIIVAEPDDYADSLEIAYKYVYCTEAEVITLSLEKASHKQGEEKIFLIREEDDRLSLKVSFPAFQRIVRIEGRDSENNRMMPDFSWANGYMMSPSMVKFETEYRHKQDLAAGADPDAPYGFPMSLNFPSTPKEVLVFLSTRTDSIQGAVVAHRRPNIVIRSGIFYDEEQGAKVMPVNMPDEQEIGVFYKNEKHGVMDVEGNVFVKPTYYHLKHITGSVFQGQEEMNDSEQLFRLDTINNVLIPLGYTYEKPTAGRTCDNVLRVYYWGNPEDEGESLRYGVINDEGEIVVPVIYHFVATCISDANLIIVRKYEDNSKYNSLDGLCNSEGKELLPVAYEYFTFKDGLITAYPKQSEKPTEFYQYDPENQLLVPVERSKVIEMLQGNKQNEVVL